jgi:hypothetical protein
VYLLVFTHILTKCRVQEAKNGTINVQNSTGLRSALCWDFTQLNVIVSTASRENVSGLVGCPETSV